MLPHTDTSPHSQGAAGRRQFPSSFVTDFAVLLLTIVPTLSWRLTFAAQQKTGTLAPCRLAIGCGHFSCHPFEENDSIMNSNASCQRTMRPTEGEGKCAVHIKVPLSQNRSKSSRRVSPACRES
jgi:hypothetical protein